MSLATSILTGPPHSPLVGVRYRAQFRRALLRWYRLHHRDLPWRGTRDPYSIWLSEIMLQQTRVAAVLQYYRTFLARFPDIQTLAAASEDQVLSAWSGLGYYRRARMLHRCAREVVDKHGGHLPQSFNALLGLPGIGRYTAAAIASIAFSEPVAVVDGNVERVLRRITGSDLTSAQTWQTAQELLVKSWPGDFNQAMMELGATLCLPRMPKCAACPVRKWCATRGEAPGRTPRPRQNKKEIWYSLEERVSYIKSATSNAALHDDGGTHEIRLVQRPQKTTLMPEMWELPQLSDSAPPPASSSRWRTFRHSITTTDYTVYVVRRSPAERVSETFSAATKGSSSEWIATHRIPEIPITGLTRKILKAGGII
jgi:A/G-specific adenine glycosylase